MDRARASTCRDAAFVTLQAEFWQYGELCLREMQDLLAVVTLIQKCHSPYRRAWVKPKPPALIRRCV